MPRDERRQFAPAIARIAEVVAETFDVAADDLFIRRKGRGAKNQPRQVAMYLARKVGDYRLTEIAMAFDLSHYGGVSNAIHRVSVAMADDKRLRRAVNGIINRFDP